MFDQHINQYGKRLYGLCLKLCTHRENAEDLYQETWIKAYKAYDKYDKSKPFEAWLTAICVNTYRDMLRKQKWHSLFLNFRTIEEQDAVIENIPSAEATDEYDIKNAIETLPDKYRLVVVLHYFNGLDIKETASFLNIPEGTVKYRLHKAREILGRRLEQDG